MHNVHKRFRCFYSLMIKLFCRVVLLQRELSNWTCINYIITVTFSAKGIENFGATSEACQLPLSSRGLWSQLFIWCFTWVSIWSECVTFYEQQHTYCGVKICFQIEISLLYYLDLLSTIITFLSALVSTSL